MRTELIQRDLVDCVIGIGKNLFFNSPMEACIVICRTKKENKHRGKILFINAKDEVTRKNSQSYLEVHHIQKIVSAYENYEDVDGFSKVVSLDEIKQKNYKLSIPYYVFNDTAESHNGVCLTISDAIEQWLKSSDSVSNEYKTLLGLLEE